VSSDLENFCERQLTRLGEAGVLAILDADDGARRALPGVATASDFVCDALTRVPDLAKWLIGEGQVARALQPGEMATRVAIAVAEAADAPNFMAALRR